MIKNFVYFVIDRLECIVRVKVLDDVYINVIIYDMEWMVFGEECDGGLCLCIVLFCNFDEIFLWKIVCSFSGNMMVF